MKWINVNDRLPKVKQKVLVYGRALVRGRTAMEHKVMIGLRQHDHVIKSLFVACPAYYQLNITHWMPLPSKPRNADKGNIE